MDVNALLGVRESYQAPAALMGIIMDPQKLTALAIKYCADESDLSREHFREYFMDQQSDRKGDKQDYTPDSIGDLITGIVGQRQRVLDIAGGIGGLTIHQWSQYQDGEYIVEEISSASLPFLLFNLFVRRIHAKVIHGDSLRRVAKDVYTVANDRITKVEHTDENLKKYDLRGWVDEL
ncbi:hypothetical protein HWN39_10625 [Lactobacillus rhamnosus]|uniref:DNA methylase adenine-specific domain-containing protein n=1 Tax=Lacticaseibacillus rhamnosus TaxID=47715 RepID=A0A7Y7UIY3_LACRH|nr:hypothetical protein [Lacticaseibacillus rhamnosus]NVO88932.1 hypothetical protein [Lacticaseibacillus rhamnosus]